jgi:hypothetical protein
MGTNYYAVMAEHETDCPHCNRPGYLAVSRWHIGKSSYGWCFSLHVGSGSEPEIPKNLEEWQEAWKDALRIEDEYGRVLMIEEMEKIITQRHGVQSPEAKYPDTTGLASWYKSNYAEPGPNNLARHSLGHGCVGHGEGTWDLITGEFS